MKSSKNQVASICLYGKGLNHAAIATLAGEPLASKLISIGWAGEHGEMPCLPSATEALFLAKQAIRAKTKLEKGAIAVHIDDPLPGCPNLKQPMVAYSDLASWEYFGALKFAAVGPVC